MSVDDWLWPIECRCGLHYQFHHLFLLVEFCMLIILILMDWMMFLWINVDIMSYHVSYR